MRGAFVALGVEKIRLTGGEPLLRKELERLVERLATIDGLDLTLTTNASLLARKAQALRDAGLDRVNVSLDSLDDATFRSMNDVDFPVARVLEGIDAAAAAGLPVKVNAVVKRGVNDARRRRHGPPLPRHGSHAAVHRVHGRRHDQRLAARRRRARRARSSSGSTRCSRSSPSTPPTAARSRSAGAIATARGEIGVITSVTQPFCGDCTRARISAEGKLYTCLFAARGTDLRALLRSGASDEELAEAIAGVWTRRADRYSEIRTERTSELPADRDVVHRRLTGGGTPRLKPSPSPRSRSSSGRRRSAPG